MIDAYLGVKTCDKCGKKIKKTQDVFVVSDGEIVHSNEVLGLKYSLVYYVCHKNCWDGNVYMGWE